MQGVQNRKAQFRTAICLILDGKKHLFEGIVKGEIIKKKNEVRQVSDTTLSLCPKDILKLLPN